MYRSIVVASDGSEQSQRPLDEAVRSGTGSQSTVRVVFVADAAALSPYPVRYRDKVFGNARRMLDGARERVRAAGLGCQTYVLETQNTTDHNEVALYLCHEALTTSRDGMVSRPMK
ncbi:universal stress protein [Caballeronia grimmiae]|uniref:universal stress protein n=1 Tax=Caballeronia grimmiae TaxID=1071679 RepID=UPI0038BC428F